MENNLFNSTSNSVTADRRQSKFNSSNSSFIILPPDPLIPRTFIPLKKPNFNTDIDYIELPPFKHPENDTKTYDFKIQKQERIFTSEKDTRLLSYINSSKMIKKLLYSKFPLDDEGKVTIENIVDLTSKKKKHKKKEVNLNNELFNYINTLKFESKFESGNLQLVYINEDYDLNELINSQNNNLNNANNSNQSNSNNQTNVVKPKPTSHNYKLFLHNDTNTNGYSQWFFFKVTNGIKGEKYNFEIMNFTRIKSKYQFGLKIWVYSTKKSINENIGWHHTTEKVNNYKNFLYRIINDKFKFYGSLSFDYTFEYDDDEVFFANCIPYTYTDLMKELNEYQKYENTKYPFFIRKTLCTTLGGNDLDYIIINKMDSKPKLCLNNNNSNCMSNSVLNRFSNPNQTETSNTLMNSVNPTSLSKYSNKKILSNLSNLSINPVPAILLNTSKNSQSNLSSLNTLNPNSISSSNTNTNTLTSNNTDTVSVSTRNSSKFQYNSNNYYSANPSNTNINYVNNTTSNIFNDLSSSYNQNKIKSGIVMLARVHPSESVGSWTIKGATEFLLGNSDEANFLRDNYIFKIIPMLNPDGVINGNTRTSYAGCDLNRRWNNTNENLYPEIFAAKNLILDFAESRKIEFIIDFHGHFGAFNSFFYCNKDKDNFAFSKFYPYLCGKMSDYILYEKCKFSMLNYKSGTSRINLYRELNLENIFTLESSNFGCIYGKYKNKYYNINMMKEIGVDICMAILKYHYSKLNKRQTNILNNQYKCFAKFQDELKEIESGFNKYIGEFRNTKNNKEEQTEKSDNTEREKNKEKNQEELLLDEIENDDDNGEEDDDDSDSEPSIDNLDLNTIKSLIPKKTKLIVKKKKNIKNYNKLNINIYKKNKNPNSNNLNSNDEEPKISLNKQIVLPQIKQKPILLLQEKNKIITNKEDPQKNELPQKAEKKADENDPNSTVEKIIIVRNISTQTEDIFFKMHWSFFLGTYTIISCRSRAEFNRKNYANSPSPLKKNIKSFRIDNIIVRNPNGIGNYGIQGNNEFNNDLKFVNMQGFSGFKKSLSPRINYKTNGISNLNSNNSFFNEPNFVISNSNCNGDSVSSRNLNMNMNHLGNNSQNCKTKISIYKSQIKNGVNWIEHYYKDDGKKRSLLGSMNSLTNSIKILMPK